MSEKRDIQNVISSFAHSWLFAFVAYCHLGSIIHRSTRHRQHYYLPLIFAFFPALFTVQIAFAIILLPLNIFLQCESTARPRQINNERGPWFYICSCLGLNYQSQGPEGTNRLWTKSVLERYNKYESDDFKRVPFVMRALVLIWGIYQGVSASFIYGKRITSTVNATLAMDRLTGIYAISGTAVMVATLIIVVQPYEWRDVPSDGGTRSGRGNPPMTMFVSLAVLIGSSVWTDAISEVVSVGRGDVAPGIMAWETPNPGAEDLYHLFWSLWT